MLGRAKKMLRRVENVTVEMPDVWFRYRNYFTRTPTVGDDANENQPSVRVGQNRVELGGGHSLTFTGCLASLEWLSISGHDNIQPPVGQDAEEAAELTDPDAPLTRSRAAKLSSPERKRLGLGTEKRKGAKAQKREVKRAKKLQRRQTQRATRSAAKRGPGEHREDVEMEESLAAAQQLLREEATAASSGSSDEDTQAAQSTRVSDAGEDEIEYEVKSLLDHRVSSGVTEYLVDWKPIRGTEYEPSWEPEEFVSHEAIQAYRRANPVSRSTRGRRGRGRPPGRGRSGRGRGGA